jgi:imidazolonepropionase-like amidohydrolase
MRETLAIIGATVIDGRGGPPIRDCVVLVEPPRIAAVIGSAAAIPPGAKRIDATGKYVLPGLMDANVHLMAALRMEDLVRHEDGFEGLIREAAQIALKNGVTTVFDTWGPREPLMRVRD